MPQTLTRTLEFTLLGRAGRVGFGAPAGYTAADPFSVRIRFPGTLTVDGTDAHWEFGRDLLAAGLESASGEGDVLVRPLDGRRTGIGLRTGQGRAELATPTAALRSFLAATFALVPAGRERIRLDWAALSAAGGPLDPPAPH